MAEIIHSIAWLLEALRLWRSQRKAGAGQGMLPRQCGRNVSCFADPVAAFRNFRRAMKRSGLLLTEPRA